MERFNERFNLDFSDFKFDELPVERRQLQEFRSWLDETDFTTWNKPYAWTFTFEYEQSIDSAKKKMRHFLNVLNKKVFGNAHFRFNKSLKCIPIIEKDENTRIHYHLILEHLSRGNMMPETYFLLMQSLWKHGRVKTNGLYMNDENASWKNYILKNRTKQDLKDLSIDIENLSL